MNEDVRLEVMVAAYGKDALERVAQEGHLQEIDGVRYLISCQIPGNESVDVPNVLTSRKDVKIEFLNGNGVSRNRNNLLEMATAPYVLIADDDIVYEAEKIRPIIGVLDANPDVDIAIFKVEVDEFRPYPKSETVLEYKRLGRNFYPYTFETAIRRASIEKIGLRFNEQYGTNAEVLGAGEEDVFLYDAWRKGLKMKFFPIEILTHKGHTTIVRRQADKDVVMARGAVLQHIYGRQRMKFSENSENVYGDSVKKEQKDGFCGTLWLRILKLAFGIPGNKLRNLKWLVEGVKYEKKIANKERR